MRSCLGLLLLSTLSLSSACRTAGDPGELRELHKAALDAHVAGDWRFMVDTATDPTLMVSNGEIREATAEQLEAMFRPYLSSSTFTKYEDTREPIVCVSDDGSLGWVLARVRVEGSRTVANGKKSLDSTWAWVSLFKKIDGNWKLVANVSTRARAP